MKKVPYSVFKIDMLKQKAKKEQFTKDLKSKKFRKKTKILEYAKKFI
tara:strand:+ start:35 stop:175 length:141 start_codon:yes stop_codon:yes gene_type:complete